MNSALKGKAVPSAYLNGASYCSRFSFCSFLTSGLGEGECSAPTPRPPFALGTRWVGPRVGLDAEAGRKTLYPCLGSNPGRPVSSQALPQLARLVI